MKKLVLPCLLLALALPASAAVVPATVTTTGASVTTAVLPDDSTVVKFLDDGTFTVSDGATARILLVAGGGAGGRDCSGGGGAGGMIEVSNVVLSAGTGNPLFSTDTCAALRAREIGADVIVKATKVDGIYTADPKKDASAKKLEHLTYGEALARGLRVMDAAAFALCQEHQIPILVLDFFAEGALESAVAGGKVGTLVDGADPPPVFG